MSPSMPKHRIVEDDADYELNNDRETLANIRKERAESWQFDSTDRDEHVTLKKTQLNISITHHEHFSSVDQCVQKP